MTTIGVVGCGAMGLPMALALRRAGHDTVGYDVRPIDEFGDLIPCMLGSLGAMAARADVVISVVRDSDQTMDVIRGLGLDRAPVPGARTQTFVVSSTLSPRFVTSLSGIVRDGVSLVDAPMSGSTFRARAGTLSFMLGGSEADIDRLLPLFEAMGETLHRLGPYGAGMAAKVLNNFVAATSAASVRTVLAQAQDLGLAPDKLLSVLQSSSGGTWFGDNLAAIEWSAEPFDPGNTFGILDKDVRAYLDAVSGGGAPDALTAAVLDRLRHVPEFPDELSKIQEDT